MPSMDNTVPAMMSSPSETDITNDSDSSPSRTDSPSDTQILSDIQEISDAEMMVSVAASMKSAADKSSSKSDSPIKTTRETRIKRPMNAFMVWSQQRRQQIAATGQKFHNSDISKMLGAEWRKMADDEKIPFVDRAKQLREEHFHTYPDYVYRPRRRKRIGKSTGSVDSVSTDEASGSPTASTNIYAAFFSELLMYMKNNQHINSAAHNAASIV
ncbi:hypothetical protein GCK72_024109 [Caenorhabditis remanei]|uniref:Sex-determining region Y protein n=1 Tax=Caenorhabditis remanei TaxID=31234 RepID=A0A6A5FYW8_CAERE|nr:hypothetical protein GCK72_024109 [Caenorhabditis remanei]KAF1747644.1 hypothetical protein GCK72_024109 [Caenorhabditis remanei]